MIDFMKTKNAPEFQKNAFRCKYIVLYITNIFARMVCILLQVISRKNIVTMDTW